MKFQQNRLAAAASEIVAAAQDLKAAAIERMGDVLAAHNDDIVLDHIRQRLGVETVTLDDMPGRLIGYSNPDDGATTWFLDRQPLVRILAPVVVDREGGNGYDVEQHYETLQAAGDPS